MFRVRLQFNGSRTLDQTNKRQGRRVPVSSRYKGKRVFHYMVYEALIPKLRTLWLVRGPSAICGAARNKKDATSIAIRLWHEDTNIPFHPKNEHCRHVQSCVSVEVLEVLTRQGW